MAGAQHGFNEFPPQEQFASLLMEYASNGKVSPPVARGSHNDQLLHEKTGCDMKREDRKPIFLLPGEGRSYSMGPISALFKADCDETAGYYSISEWWLDPYTKGPGAHKHDEDDVFFVLEGTMHFLVVETWTDAPKGSFVLAPGGTTHDFENRGAVRAGVLNISAPGNFERHMPDIVSWFEEHPPGKADS